MFLDHTVVVVGAGASSEAGLLLGYGLKNSISKLTEFKFDHGSLVAGDGHFWQDLLRLDHFNADRNRIFAACRKISRGILFCSSVDSFLEIHRNDADVQCCAKAAIIRLIIDGERKSLLHIKTNNIYNALDPKKLEGTWFLELAHALFEGVESANIGAAFEPVTFVSFNYDRCLEWFLFHAIQGLYSCTAEIATQALKNLKILHPYGDVGKAPWINGGAGNTFGSENSGNIARANGRILTFTEYAIPSDIVGDVRLAIENCQSLIFLGFAFHPQNIDLLWDQHTDKQPRNIMNIMGTSKDMSEQDRSTIERELVRRLRHRNSPDPHVTLPPISCSEFMRQFKRSITKQARAN